MTSRATMARASWAAVLACTILLTGCRKAVNEVAKGAGVPSKVARSAKKLPDQVELSRIKGVSIVQCPPGDNSGHMITGDGVSSHGKAEKAPLSKVIQTWCDFDGWVFMDADLPDVRYNITVEAEKGGAIWPLAKKAIEQVFSLRFVEGKELTDVWVLARGKDFPEGLKAVDANHSSWGTAQTTGGFGYEVRAGTMEALIGIVSKYVDEPVLDETGIQGFYKFTLAMDHWKPNTLHPAIEQLGLKLQKGKRELPVMRVVLAAASSTTPPQSSAKPPGS